MPSDTRKRFEKRPRNLKNYYAILEVPVGCGVPEIARAYRRLAADSGDDVAAVADLNEAYAVLTSPARRADYDRAVWGETFPEVGEGPTPGAASGAPTGVSSLLSSPLSSPPPPAPWDRGPGG